MKLALDPHTYHRAMSVADELRKAADLGYSYLESYLELSPRADWFFWQRYPKADDALKPLQSEHAFYRSVEELIPEFERYGIGLNLEAHPYDFSETNDDTVQIVRGIKSRGSTACSARRTPSTSRTGRATCGG